MLPVRTQCVTEAGVAGVYVRTYVGGAEQDAAGVAAGGAGVASDWAGAAAPITGGGDFDEVGPDQSPDHWQCPDHWQLIGCLAAH